MAKLLVIGCGGVAQVAIQKCCQNDGLFTELVLASRTKAKCDALKEKLAGKTKTPRPRSTPITSPRCVCLSATSARMPC